MKSTRGPIVSIQRPVDFPRNTRKCIQVGSINTEWLSRDFMKFDIDTSIMIWAKVHSEEWSYADTLDPKWFAADGPKMMCSWIIFWMFISSIYFDLLLIPSDWTYG